MGRITAIFFSTCGALAFSACGADSGGSGGGSSDAFEGTYEVSKYTTTNGAGCSGAGAAASGGKSFFKLALKDFSGAEPYLQFTWCSSETACDSESLFAGWLFDTKTGQVWSGDAYVELSESGDACSLRIDTNEASLGASSSVALEKLTYQGTVAELAGKDCAETAQTEAIREAYVEEYRSASAMSCVTKEVLEGTRI